MLKEFNYIAGIKDLTTTFKSEKSNFELVVELTNHDFDNRNFALARHKSFPFILRHIVKVDGEYGVVLLDFKDNALLSVIKNVVEKKPIGKQMHGYLRQDFNLKYDDITPPTFTP